MKDPFLFDECLSPECVELAHQRGYRATHVNFRGLQSLSDPSLVKYAMAESLVIVTNNRRDFLKLYAREQLHPGLVVIVPGGLRIGEQVEYSGYALDAIDLMPETVNKLVRVLSDRSVIVSDWPE